MKNGHVRMDSHEVELSLICRSPLVKYILVGAERDKATELGDKLDRFRSKFIMDFAIETRVKQGMIFVPDVDCPRCLIRGIRCRGEVHACQT